MPRKGHKSVTISDKHGRKLAKMAKANHRSESKQVEFLIDEM